MGSYHAHCPQAHTHYSIWTSLCPGLASGSPGTSLLATWTTYSLYTSMVMLKIRQWRHGCRGWSGYRQSVGSKRHWESTNTKLESSYRWPSTNTIRAWTVRDPESEITAHPGPSTRSSFSGSLGPRFSLEVVGHTEILNSGFEDCDYVSVVQIRSKSHPMGPGKVERANCGGGASFSHFTVLDWLHHRAGPALPPRVQSACL